MSLVTKQNDLAAAKRTELGDSGRRTIIKGALSLSVLSALSSVHIGSAYAQPNLDVDDFIATLVREFNLPGVGVAFVEDSSLAWHKSFGVTNVSTEQPVTQTTLFQAASLSKPIFAYVVLKAIENGELGLDDRLVEHYRPQDLIKDAFSEQVTVRDALQHTSGMPNWRPDGDGPQPLKLNYMPGTDSSYSGEAYHWLQRVMENITGEGLDVFMRKRLFEPAGFPDMQMLWSPDRDSRESYHHVIDEMALWWSIHCSIEELAGGRCRKWLKNGGFL